MTVCSALPAAACLAVVSMGPPPVVAVILLCLALASIGAVVAGALLVAADLIPEYAGVAMGISNTLGTIPGVLAPMLAGDLLDRGGCPPATDDTTGARAGPACIDAWRTIFIITASMAVAGALVFEGMMRVKWGGGFISYRRTRDTMLRPLMPARQAEAGQHSP